MNYTDPSYAFGLETNRLNAWFDNRAALFITYQVDYLELRDDVFPATDEFFWLY